MGGFAPAAGNGYGISGNAFESRGGSPQMVVKRERRSFFDADSACSDPAIRQSCSRSFCRALILLPDTNLSGELELFPHSSFFKSWHDDDRVSGPRKH